MEQARRLLMTAVIGAALAGCSAPPASPADPAWADPALAATPATTPATTAPSSAPASTTAGTPSPSATRSPQRTKPSRKPTPKPTRSSAPTSRYVFPVRAGRVDYHPTHAKYPATDLFAACGSPVVAVTDGRVLEVSRVDKYVKGRPDGPNNGGLFVSVLGNDGVRYYGSHLSRVADGIDAGVRVRAGQRLGSVGRTGNANNVCHLHFGLSPACAQRGDWKVRRGVVWPSRFLDSWRNGRALSPAAKVSAWRRSHNCQA